MRKTYLLVFVHGFKGSDTTFKQYPWDLQKLVQKELPLVDVLSIQYPQFPTQGDLWKAITDFKEWLHNKVADLEAANHNPNPVDDPSVHVVLVGHSMGGIVSAETLLGIARGEVKSAAPIPSSNSTQQSHTTNNTTPTIPADSTSAPLPTRSNSQPPDLSTAAVFFPHVRAILALDTPWLGISPGVIAFGAESGWNQAAQAWKTVTSTTEKWGWTKASQQPATDGAATAAASTGRSARRTGAWSAIGKAVAFTGAATAIAGAAGAAYFGWNHLSLGATWVGSHLEFISCLTKGEELKQRLQAVIRLTETRGIGFAQFYVALGEKMVQQTAQYSGYMVGDERTFVYVPYNTTSDICKAAGVPRSPSSPSSRSPPGTPRVQTADGQAQEAHLADEMEDGDKVEAYAKDASKSKGRWVKCVNDIAGDELTAHRTMFIAPRNPGYFTQLLPQTRDQIVQWVDREWYETSEPPLAKEADEHDWKSVVDESPRQSFDLD